MKTRTPNEINRLLRTLQTHPLEIEKAWLRIFCLLMNFGAPSVRQRVSKLIILGAKRHRTTHQEIIRKSSSKNLQFWCQSHTKMTPTLVHNIAPNCANKLQRNMLWKNMCLRKCKLCKSNVQTSVFEGFANRMQDDGNQQKYSKENIYKNPYKIDDKSV